MAFHHFAMKSLLAVFVVTEILVGAQEVTTASTNVTYSTQCYFCQHTPENASAACVDRTDALVTVCESQHCLSVNSYTQDGSLLQSLLECGFPFLCNGTKDGEMMTQEVEGGLLVLNYSCCSTDYCNCPDCPRPTPPPTFQPILGNDTYTDTSAASTTTETSTTKVDSTTAATTTVSSTAATTATINSTVATTNAASSTLTTANIASSTAPITTTLSSTTLRPNPTSSTTSSSNTARSTSPSATTTSSNTASSTSLSVTTASTTTAISTTSNSNTASLTTTTQSTTNGVQRIPCLSLLHYIIICLPPILKSIL